MCTTREAKRSSSPAPSTATSRAASDMHLHAYTTHGHTHTTIITVLNTTSSLPPKYLTTAKMRAVWISQRECDNGGGGGRSNDGGQRPRQKTGCAGDLSILPSIHPSVGTETLGCPGTASPLSATTPTPPIPSYAGYNPRAWVNPPHVMSYALSPKSLHAPRQAVRSKSILPWDHQPTIHVCLLQGTDERRNGSTAARPEWPKKIKRGSKR